MADEGIPRLIIWIREELSVSINAGNGVEVAEVDGPVSVAESAQAMGQIDLHLHGHRLSLIHIW